MPLLKTNEIGSVATNGAFRARVNFTGLRHATQAAASTTNEDLKKLGQRTLRQGERGLDRWLPDAVAANASNKFVDADGNVIPDAMSENNFQELVQKVFNAATGEVADGLADL